MDEVFEGVFVGDINDAKNAQRDRFNAVVTLSEHPVDVTTHYRPLVDGKNEQSEFNEAVAITRDALEQDGPVLVHCSSGQSRSVTAVATVMAEKKNRPFDKIVALIKSKRRKAAPTYYMRQHAYEYLGEETTTLDELFDSE